MLTLIFAAALAAQATAAPSPAGPPRLNCDSAPDYHKLDFWIGDWDVLDTDKLDGPVQARAHVDPIASGCAIHELYEQNDGLIGDSILSYDPVRRQWQQTWVTNRGSIMMLFGGFTDGRLTLEGESHQRDGSTVMQRITWEAHARGVREWAVLSKDRGKTWSPAFDVVFVKPSRAPTSG